MYPQRGGTGGIWQKVAALLPKDKMRMNSKVTAMDLDRRCLVLANGDIIKYKYCISTMPLDYTLKLLGQGGSTHCAAVKPWVLESRVLTRVFDPDYRHFARGPCFQAVL